MVILWPEIESVSNLVKLNLDDGQNGHLDLILDGVMSSKIESGTYGENDLIYCFHF